MLVNSFSRELQCYHSRLEIKIYDKIKVNLAQINCFISLRTSWVQNLIRIYRLQVHRPTDNTAIESTIVNDWIHQQQLLYGFSATVNAMWKRFVIIAKFMCEIRSAVEIKFIVNWSFGSRSVNYNLGSSRSVGSPFRWRSLENWLRISNNMYTIIRIFCFLSHTESFGCRVT